MKKNHVTNQIKICINLHNKYFSLGLKSIINAYFDDRGILTNFINELDEGTRADILFCDASPYNPQLACAKISRYSRVFTFEYGLNTLIKKPYSCGCRDAIFSYDTPPDIITRKLAEILVFPVEEKSPCLISTLSKREKQVLDYIAQGVKSQRISDVLLISIKTLSTHKMNAMKKLKINTSTGLYYWLKENAAHLKRDREQCIQ